MLVVLLAVALTNSTSTTTAYEFETLTPAQVSELSKQSDRFCKEDKESRIPIPLGSRTKCEVDQPFLIQHIDVNLGAIKSFGSPRYAKLMVARCFEFYSISKKGDLEQLNGCVEQAAILAEQELNDLEAANATLSSDSRVSPFDTDAFCRRVAGSVGGSYVLLEQCLKDEAAARKRVR